MIEAGHVRYMGVSEAGAETSRRAPPSTRGCCRIQYSLVSRGVQSEILPTARELGVRITGYGVLPRGLPGGHWSNGAGQGAPRRPPHSPASPARTWSATWSLVDALRGIAGEQGGARRGNRVSPWDLAQGDEISYLAVARQRDGLAEALGALDLEGCPAADLALIKGAIPDYARRR